MNESLPVTGYVRLPDVLKVYPVSKSTWWAGIKSGKYPAGVKLSERVTAWKVEDIRALIQGDREVRSKPSIYETRGIRYV